MVLAQAIRTVGCGVLTGALVFVSTPLATADQIRQDQWALEALNAQSVWNISQGSGVTVAVIDDGVNANHIDLQGNVLEGKDFMDGGPTTPRSGDDHGTAMASIIVAHGHGTNDGVIGLAPKAKSCRFVILVQMGQDIPRPFHTQLTTAPP
ncbi:S8 family serine peptidase [Streptomyces bicolor]|uniref:S8 family serine peptidase n=1 Tax=Streptomyces bicolor TaxID=66874 RepID=UPI0022773BD5|nr:S8 family serine peptidase [Streptomyces bicolor]